MLLPRGVLGRNIECGEVVIVGLDVRPFGNGETHVGKDLGDLVHHLRDRVDTPLCQRTGACRQRDIGFFPGKPF